MADYQMLGELLGLPHVSVLGYQITGNERIEVQIRCSLAARAVSRLPAAQYADP